MPTTAPSASRRTTPRCARSSACRSGSAARCSAISTWPSPRAGAFSADDEDLVTALAATAGTAIANARLYEDARRSRDWLHASGEIARALLADADADTLLDVVSRALHVAEADYARARAARRRRPQLAMAVAAGVGADASRGSIVRPATSLSWVGPDPPAEPVLDDRRQIGAERPLRQHHSASAR